MIGSRDRTAGQQVDQELRGHPLVLEQMAKRRVLTVISAHCRLAIPVLRLAEGWVDRSATIGDAILESDPDTQEQGTTTWPID